MRHSSGFTSGDDVALYKLVIAMVDVLIKAIIEEEERVVISS
jgi:hypothetical protein